MTRINLVDPSQLTDKHLMAEYRELPRVFTAVRKLQDQGKSPKDIDIPETYVLGQGHVKFFYTKLQWLSNRYEKIYEQLLIRGFSLDRSLYSAVLNNTVELINDNWWHWYEPTPEEIYLNMIRICKRSKIQKVLDELSAE